MSLAEQISVCQLSVENIAQRSFPAERLEGQVKFEGKVQDLSSSLSEQAVSRQEGMNCEWQPPDAIMRAHWQPQVPLPASASACAGNLYMRKADGTDATSSQLNPLEIIGYSHSSWVADLTGLRAIQIRPQRPTDLIHGNDTCHKYTMNRTLKTLFDLDHSRQTGR